MPAGMEIIIAIEKPSAMTTNNARTFLLETFLTALVKVPKMIHLYVRAAFNPKKGERQAINFGFLPPGLRLGTRWFFTAAISLGCNISSKTADY